MAAVEDARKTLAEAERTNVDECRAKIEATLKEHGLAMTVEARPWIDEGGALRFAFAVVLTRSRP